jgi:tetratricopeptide (TPR) repeat protein
MAEALARVLPFKNRRERQRFSPDQAREVARAYLANSQEDRPVEVSAAVLGDPDSLLALCAEIRERCDAEPAVVYREASSVYQWLKGSDKSLGLFDERDYFLGETALAAGNAARLLGKRDEAEVWFDRAEAGFRHTVNPAPLLASVSYARLTLHYDRRQYERVFEVVPSVADSFRRLQMRRERLKCEFLEAMALKESSRTAEALAKLEGMRADSELSAEPKLEAFVMIHSSELLASMGRYAEAVGCLSQVANRDVIRTQPLLAGALASTLAETFRQQGKLTEAAEALQRATEEYAAAGMRTLEAYLRILLAETLIALSRHREAEWHIAAALPTIEEQEMRTEGVAAVALLRESVRARRADPVALQKVREHLQK